MYSPRSAAKKKRRRNKKRSQVGWTKRGCATQLLSACASSHSSWRGLQEDGGCAGELAGAGGPVGPKMGKKGS